MNLRYPKDFDDRDGFAVPFELGLLIVAGITLACVLLLLLALV